MLNRWLLLQATASTGTMNTPTPIFQGEPLNDIPFQIRIVDDARVQIVTNDFQNRAPDSAEAQRALNREFSDEILYTLEIKARDKTRKSILLDVSSMFKTDIAQIADNFKVLGFGYGLDISNSYIDGLKVFPDNAVIRTMHRLSWQGPSIGAPKSVPFAVSYNISALPTDGYKPRLGDQRVGYFTTSFSDHSDSENSDPTVNYIYRWRLEKQDPSAALSPPKKPIVFYIDNAMPKPYRKAATEGLLLWNKAFEKVGIKDAIEVRQMPDDADWDIADVRYNVVRWTVNVPFAIALMRASPLTGEILNASINFDSGFASEGAFESDALQDLSEPEAGGPVLPHLKHPGSLACEYPEAAARNVGFAAEALEVFQPMATDEKQRLVYEYIREIACHEMGHCLGLRHNFIASTFLTNKQLGDKATVDREGISASVMDYNMENIEAITHPGVSYYSGTTGRYDKWAIGYGYMPIDAATPKGELFALRAYASHTNEPGLAFQTDGMANNWDPEVRTFDMSSDPLEWCKRMSHLAAATMKDLDKRHPKPGESYFEFTKRYNSIRSIGILRPLTYSVTFVGGTTVSSSFKGDPGQKPPVSPLPMAKQKEALDFICGLMLSESSPGISPKIAAMLAANPNAPGNEPFASQRLFPVLDTVSATQRAAILLLFQPQRLNLIVNNEYRSNDTLPLATLFSEVKANVWSELGDGHPISTSRRNLQRDHLRTLILIALGKQPAPGDAVALANAELHELEPVLSKALAKSKDPMQKAHLLDCLSQVHRALDARAVTS
jgi:hypothetical protein